MDQDKAHQLPIKEMRANIPRKDQKMVTLITYNLIEENTKIKDKGPVMVGGQVRFQSV